MVAAAALRGLQAQAHPPLPGRRGPVLHPRGALAPPQHSAGQRSSAAVGSVRAVGALLAGLAAARARRRHSVRAKARGIDRPEDFSAISEYKALKANPLSSWAFLEEDQFLIRMLVLFLVNFGIGLAFCAAVYPPQSLSNVVVAGLFAVAIACTVTFGVLLFILRQWDMVNKSLLKKSYVVEGRSPDQRFGDGGAYAYAEVKSKKDTRRDRLLAGYVTEPVVSRLRLYLVASLALSVTAWGGGAVVGGEMDVAEEEEEEAEAEGSGTGMFSIEARTGGRDQPGFKYFLERS